MKSSTLQVSLPDLPVALQAITGCAVRTDIETGTSFAVFSLDKGAPHRVRERAKRALATVAAVTWAKKESTLSALIPTSPLGAGDGRSKHARKLVLTAVTT